MKATRKATTKATIEASIARSLLVSLLSISAACGPARVSGAKGPARTDPASPGGGPGSDPGAANPTFVLPDAGGAVDAAAALRPDLSCGLQRHRLTRLPPELLLVLDRSGSMRDLVDGTASTRWNETTAALDEVLARTDGSILWGLKSFPTPEGCEVLPDVEVPIGPASQPVVEAVRITLPNDGASGTPTAAAIQAGNLYLRTLRSLNPEISGGGHRRPADLPPDRLRRGGAEHDGRHPRRPGRGLSDLRDRHRHRRHRGRPGPGVDGDGRRPAPGGHARLLPGRRPAVAGECARPDRPGGRDLHLPARSRRSFTRRRRRHCFLPVAGSFPVNARTSHDCLPRWRIDPAMPTIFSQPDGQTVFRMGNSTRKRG